MPAPSHRATRSAPLHRRRYGGHSGGPKGITMGRTEHRIRRRRWAIVGGLTVLSIGGAAGVAQADGGLTITPASGAPGTSYAVEVSCGQLPLIRERHTQDAYVQMTIAPFGPDDVTEVSPSLWQVTDTAGSTDEEYFAQCDGAEAGTGRFDAESPHLWFGPRPPLGPDTLIGKTTVEGTDCPAGTEATVEIAFDRDIVLPRTGVPIDQYGDWTVELPRPVGDTNYSITASCGSVTYDALAATSTSTSSSVPELVDPTVTAPQAAVPAPAPATARPGRAGYTG